MPIYRIHRMKEAPRENFRWAPHTGGLAVVKAKDYDPDGEIEAATPYAAWKVLASEARLLRPGDLLELLNHEGVAIDLRITKYIGFEPAQWYVPEVKQEPTSSGALSPSLPPLVATQ